MVTLGAIFTPVTIVLVAIGAVVLAAAPALARGRITGGMELHGVAEPSPDGAWAGWLRPFLSGAALPVAGVGPTDDDAFGPAEPSPGRNGAAGNGVSANGVAGGHGRAAGAGGAVAGEAQDAGDASAQAAPAEQQEEVAAVAGPTAPAESEPEPLPGWAAALLRRWRDLGPVLALYLATRAVTFGLLIWAAAHQGANPWGGAPPTLQEFVGLFWDAGWYQRIIADSYPLPVPVSDDGALTQSAWAFFPLFPLLVRTVMLVTGAGFAAAAPVVAFVLGVAAAVVVFVLVRQEVAGRTDARTGRRAGLLTVLALGVFPAAPALQVAYTESLALLLLALALLFLTRRRYVLVAIAVLALGLTRAVALPFVAVLAVHAYLRWRDARAAGVPLTRRQLGGLAALGSTAVVAGVAWPVITGIAAGRWDAYARIQEAWRSGGSVTPVVEWFAFAGSHWGALGALGVVAYITGGVLAIRAPHARVLGPELLTWAGAYLLWLLVAVQPQSSLVRLLLLAFPMGTIVFLAVPRRWWWVAVASASLAGQVAWIWVLWRLGLAYGWPP